MKSWLFCLFLFICINEINSQNYIQMLDTHKEWHLTVCNNGCITDIYYTSDDTIYNNYNYKILNGYHYISKTFWIREEVQNKKIFMSYEYNSQRRECLLYDFSLSVGDTFTITNPITPFDHFPGNFLVDSINSNVLLDGQYYNFFYLSPLNTLVNDYPIWIEGLGSLSMINAPGGNPDINNVGKLSCFFSNGSLIYSDLDSINSCISNTDFQNISTNVREIERIVDLYGRNSKEIKNNMLIYIYNDGTVEKKLLLNNF